MKEKDFYIFVSLSSFFGPSWEAEVRGVKARFIKTSDGKRTEEKESTLTAAAILALSTKLSELGVYDWEEHYLDCCMLDGSSWSVNIKSGTAAVQSRGTNGYPRNWPKFIEILEEVLGLGINICLPITSQVDKSRKAW